MKIFWDFCTLTDCVGSIRYNVSKLMEVFLVRELASRTTGSKPDVAINMLNPGLCHSELVRDQSMIANLIIRGIKAILARSGEEGGSTLVHSASVGMESHGKFMTNGAINHDE